MACSPWADRSRPNAPAISMEQSVAPPMLADSSAVRVELDVASRQNVARHRDNCGACGDPTRSSLHRDVAFAPDDAIDGGGKRNRNLLAELGHQDSQPLEAADRGTAALRACLVDGRNILQVLAGGAGAEHEVRRSQPVPQVAVQCRGAKYID